MKTTKALLPSGFYDLLAPDAAREAKTVSTLVNTFSKFGYQQVKPPLMEFEKTLISKKNKKLSKETFRVLDPISGETMGIRADMTTQVMRIANTRFKNASLPLRLCYAGQALRVKGSGVNAERQIAQAGLELIGTDSVEADVEVIMIAAEALKMVVVKELSIDFNLPSIVDILFKAAKIPEKNQAKLLGLIQKKDMAGIRENLGKSASIFTDLLQASGPADYALKKLKQAKLPKDAASHVARLEKVIGRIKKEIPDVTLTVDPLDHKGFEYHTGISFSFFSGRAASELGRGGRYVIENFSGKQSVEATGFTLYVNTILRALPKFKKKETVYVPAGTQLTEILKLQAHGFITVQGFSKDAKKEAKNLGCELAYINKKLQQI